MITKKELKRTCEGLSNQIERIDEQMGCRYIPDVPTSDCWIFANKPDLTTEIEELRETLNMLFDYLNLEIEEKTTSRQIVKIKND